MLRPEEQRIAEMIRQVAPLLDEEQTPLDAADLMKEDSGAVEPFDREKTQRIIDRVRAKIARGKES